MSTQNFGVAGMTCAHCVHAVTEELQALDGVTTVHVDLHAAGTSTVHVEADRALSAAEVGAALDEAGAYRLVP
jgi:copper chaperone CopZ